MTTGESSGFDEASNLESASYARNAERQEPHDSKDDGDGDALAIIFAPLSQDTDAGTGRSGRNRGRWLWLGLGVVVALGVGVVAGRAPRREAAPTMATGPVSVRLPGADTGLDSAVLVATTPTGSDLDARMWLIGPSVEVGVLDDAVSTYDDADQTVLVADTAVSITDGRVSLRSLNSDGVERLSMRASNLIAHPTTIAEPSTQRVGIVVDTSLWVVDPANPSTLTQRDLPEGVIAVVGALDASSFVVETDTVDAAPRWALWTSSGTLEQLDSRITDDDVVEAAAGATVAVQRSGVLRLITIGTDQEVTIDLAANALRDASQGCLSPLGRSMLIPTLDGRIAAISSFSGSNVSSTEAEVVFTTRPGTLQAGWVGPGQVVYTHTTGYPILEHVDLYTSISSPVAMWPTATTASLLASATPCIAAP